MKQCETWSTVKALDWATIMTNSKHFTHNPPAYYPELTLIEGERRCYQLPNGARYPSVTNVLGELPAEYLAKWTKRKGEKLANAIREASSLRGERLHKVLNAYLSNHQPEFPTPFTKVLFDKVRLILDKHFDNIRLLEKPLYSDKLFMAGTPDAIGDWDGQLAVIDFKGTHILKKAEWITRYFCQVGAYGEMWRELYGQQPVLGVVIVVSDDDEYEEPQVFEKPHQDCFKMLDAYVTELIAWRNSMKANTSTVH